MNIFHLSESPRAAVEAHCDAHVLKMGIEAAQMLSTAWHVTTPGELRLIEGVPYLNNHHIYRKTHENHPMTVWVRATAENYGWAWRYGMALMDEYWHRWGQDSRIQHATRAVLQNLQDIPDDLPDGELTRPPLCMPEEFHCDNYIEAYHNYYKSKLSSGPIYQRYTKRERPEWSI